MCSKGMLPFTEGFTMTIRKKSLTGALRPSTEADPATDRPAGDTVKSGESRSAHATTRAEDLTLAKRTVSRILLAKSLFGR